MKIIFYLFLVTIGENIENSEQPETLNLKGLKEYFIGFSIKRKEQFKSVDNWARNQNNYELIRLAFEAIITVTICKYDFVLLNLFAVIYNYE
jgi:hypothetical protein